MKEIWKNIEGYEGLYQVSNLGRIKSLERIINNPWKGLLRTRLVKEKIRKLPLCNNGYPTVRLSNGKGKTFKVHGIVGKTFLGKSNLEINHIDCDKTNNSINNLEYVTRGENIKHSWDNNLRTQPTRDKTTGKFN